MTWLPSGTPSGPRLTANHCKTITKSLQNQTGADGVPDKPDGPNGVPDRGPEGAPRLATNYCNPLQNRCKTRRGQTGGLTGARPGGGRKDYLLLKEKMTCSVYMSCKSSSASDVFDAGWM
jgi:hypothetical protein